MVEQVTSVVTANFAADFAALAAAKGVANLGAVTIHKRLPADIIAGEELAVPGIGVYATKATTNAKRQTLRDSRVTCVLELFLRGTSAATIRAQAELGAEAFLLSVDRVHTAGGGIFGAGEEEGGVVCEIAGGALGEGQEQYEELTRVTFTVSDRDVV